MRPSSATPGWIAPPGKRGEGLPGGRGVAMVSTHACLMASSMDIIRVLAAVGVAFAAGSAATAAEDSSVAAGRQIAQRHCAACHAIADGESPWKEAPPFAHLHYRYGAGGLAELLEKGMIKDWPRPLEEGHRLLHPRMPAFPLEEDEVVALANYLRTFEKDDDRGGPASKR